MYYEGNNPVSSLPVEITTDFSKPSLGDNMPVWLSGALGVVGGLLGNLFGISNTKKTNQTNKEINQQNLDYNEAMTRASWARDDTAHQREVADLEAAGLSPLANTTGNAVTSPISAPSPLAMQAPQIDANSIINSILQAQQLQETERHNKVNEGHTEEELRLRGKEIVNKSCELNIENKRVEGTIKYQADLIRNEQDSIANALEHNKEEEYLRRVEFESEMYWKEIKQQVPGDYSYKDYYDFDIYCDAMKLWNLQFEHFMEDIGATQKASASSKSGSMSGGTSIGATVPGSPVGVNVGANGSQSETESKYEMENISEKQKQDLINFYTKHPKPVYHVKRWEFKK